MRWGDGSDTAMRTLAHGKWDYLRAQDPWYTAKHEYDFTVTRIHRGPNLLERLTPEEACGILALFQRTYWSRMWIIQEVMLAHHLEIHCGTRVLSEYRLERFVKNRAEIADPKNHMYVPIHREIFTSPAWSIATMRLAITRPHEGMGFQRLLQTYGHHECQDMRDKVYALVGVGKHGSTLELDYRKSAKDILLDVFYLESTRMSWEGGRDRRSLLMIGFLLEKALKVPFPKTEVQFHLDRSRDIAAENLFVKNEKRSWEEFCEAVKAARINMVSPHESPHIH